VPLATDTYGADAGAKRPVLVSGTPYNGMMTFGSDFLFIRAGAKNMLEMPETKPAKA